MSDMEAELIELRKFGKPYVAAHSDGTWGCNIELEVRTEGVTFSVKSGYFNTPGMAVFNCLRRVRECLNEYEKPKTQTLIGN